MSEENGHGTLNPAEVVATLTVTLTRDGQTHLSYPNDEIQARFLVDKARAIMDMEFLKRSAMATVAEQTGIVTGDPRVIDMLNRKRRPQG